MKKKLLVSLLIFGSIFSMEHKRFPFRTEQEKKAYLQRQACNESCAAFACCLGTVLNCALLYLCGAFDSLKNN